MLLKDGPLSFMCLNCTLLRYLYLLCLKLPIKCLFSFSFLFNCSLLQFDFFCLLSKFLINLLLNIYLLKQPLLLDPLLLFPDHPFFQFSLLIQVLSCLDQNHLSFVFLVHFEHLYVKLLSDIIMLKM